MNNRHIIGTLAAFILYPLVLSSCGTVSSVSDAVEVGITRVVADPRSFRNKDEVVRVDIRTSSRSSTKMLSTSATAAIASYVAGEVIQGAEKATKNFSITYSGTELGYPLNGLEGFTVTREISTSTGATQASVLDFEVKRFGSTNYHYIEMLSAKVMYAKSATPWWKGTLDLVVDIDISSPSAGKNNATLIIDADQMVAKGIKVGGDTVFSPRGNLKSGLFELPKDSKPFFIKVSVQEMSDFSKIAEKGNKLIGEKKADWQKKLESALGGE
ncbi:hypothetical protein HZ994_12820 [Akkermansiaceae bacterium]|nr:hypothetical protein HZ994_12820 [Akkermansiaceae bacterium]